MARRNNRLINRMIRHAVQQESANDAIGQIEHGMELFCLTKGQFSIINVIEALLEQAGTADVVIATWSAADAELRKAEEFLNNNKINRLRFIVDRSFPTRKPQFYNQLKDMFGDIVSVTNIHAKFILITNKEWNLVVRTSMNLNENKRIEQFEISDDPILFEYLSSFVKEISGDSYSSKDFEQIGTSRKFDKYKIKKHQNKIEEDEEIDNDWLI